MPSLGPVKHRDLIRYLRQLGFEGPNSGGKHQFRVKGGRTLRLPNPHRSEIGKELLARILRQGGIEKDDWERL